MTPLFNFDDEISLAEEQIYMFKTRIVKMVVKNLIISDASNHQATIQAFST